MTTARAIITLALEAMNRLSPGETVDADLAAVCLRRLNAITDDWSIIPSRMPQQHIVAGAATGATLALGQGAFADVPAGAGVAQLQVDGFPMTPITMAQYNNITDKVSAGRPDLWAFDGLGTIYLYPVASGNTVHILSRKAFSKFADIDTDYLLPAGYQGAFAASLSVAMAPSLLGKITPELMLAEQRALFRIQSANIDPAIISASPLTPNCAGNILQGWNR